MVHGFQSLRQSGRLQTKLLALEVRSGLEDWMVLEPRSLGMLLPVLHNLQLMKIVLQYSESPLPLQKQTNQAKGHHLGREVSPSNHGGRGPQQFHAAIKCGAGHRVLAAHVHPRKPCKG